MNVSGSIGFMDLVEELSSCFASISLNIKGCRAKKSILDVSSYLYERLSPSIRPLVCPSTDPSLAFFCKIEQDLSLSMTAASLSFYAKLSRRNREQRTSNLAMLTYHVLY